MESNYIETLIKNKWETKFKISWENKNNDFGVKRNIKILYDSIFYFINERELVYEKLFSTGRYFFLNLVKALSYNVFITMNQYIVLRDSYKEHFDSGFLDKKFLLSTDLLEKIMLHGIKDMSEPTEEEIIRNKKILEISDFRNKEDVSVKMSRLSMLFH